MTRDQFVNSYRVEVRRVRATAIGIVASLLVANAANSQTITAFDPSDYFVVGALPTSGETALLDIAAGIDANFLIEDFEDDALVSGLTAAFSGFAPASSIPAAAGQNGPGRILDSGSAWDGERALGNQIRDIHATTFDFSVGADFFGIGIGGFHSDIELVVNGQNLGPINSLIFSEFLSNPNANERNIYLMISRNPGDAPITSVSFINDPANPNPAGDFVRFDHIAIASTIPAPATLWLAGLCITGLCRARRRK